MEIGHWLTIGAFVVTNFGVWAGVVISIRIDMREVKVNIDALEKQMEKFGNILVTLADFRGEINRIQDRQQAQGTRLDEAIKTNNDRQKVIWEKLEKLSSGGA